MTGWTLIGLGGQALFTARSTLQWVASERAGEVRLPRGYWELSLSGSLLLFAYALSVGDPVFLAGPTVNAGIFARNLMLQRRPREAGAPRAAVVVALALLLAAALALGVARLAQPPPGLAPGWLGVGVLGQALWLSRFPIQWATSERLGRSTLPASFWAAGLVGALLLFCYAVARGDVVFMLAYAFNPIPCARNLILLRRATRALPSEVSA